MPDIILNPFQKFTKTFFQPSQKPRIYKVLRHYQALAGTAGALLTMSWHLPLIG